MPIDPNSIYKNVKSLIYFTYRIFTVEIKYFIRGVVYDFNHGTIIRTGITFKNIPL